MKIHSYRLLLLVAALALFVTGFAAYAQDPATAVDAGVVVIMPVPVPIPDIEQDPAGWIARIYQAIRDGNWLFFTAGVLIALVFVIRKFVSELSFFKTPHGGALLASGLAFLGALSTALAAGQQVSVKLLLGALTVALTAMGGWTGGKKILAWLITLFKKKEPTPS